MYSRFPPERREKIRLPEHYSGCAFSPDSPYPPPAPEDREKKEPHGRVSVDSNSDARTESRKEDRENPPKELPKESPLEEGTQAESTPLPITESPKKATGLSLFGNHGLSIPIGLSFDELLLIGLILLLARSETESDIILWLVLLLFCK